MAEYTYRNAAGAVRSVYAKMSNPPPERLCFNKDDSWTPCDDKSVHDVFTRVYGCDQVRIGRSLNFPYISKRWGGKKFQNDCEMVELEVGDKHKRMEKFPVIKSIEHEKALAAKHNLVIE